MLHNSILIALFLLFAVWAYKHFLRSIIIYEYQQGLLYKNGKFSRLLKAGKHDYWHTSSHIEVMDIRKIVFSLAGQEVLTKDNVSIKISISGLYQIENAQEAHQDSESYWSVLFNYAQLALRKVVNEYELDDMLTQKQEIAQKIIEIVSPQAESIGLSVSALDVLDVMLPAPMKRACAALVENRKEAAAALEKARGEEAVLRKQANTAKLYEKSPALAQLRIMEALQSGNGNTIVLGGDGSMPIVASGDKT